MSVDIISRERYTAPSLHLVPWGTRFLGVEMSEYLSFFGLIADPFSTTPDPRYAVSTREHKLALAKIGYYVENKRGIFLLTGEIGTGKTTVSQMKLNDWRAAPNKFLAGYVTDPSPRTEAAFLRLILASFGFPYIRNVLDLKAALRSFLIEQYKAGKTVVVLIDEAQIIHPTNLDTIQMIANEQTQTAKLLQVVLVAQPNFAFKIAQKPALRSRIAGVSTLNPLTFQDSMDLLKHRMSVAGGDFATVFSEPTHKIIYNETGGVPRDLCLLCDAAMINAYARGQNCVAENDVLGAIHAFRIAGKGQPDATDLS